MSDKLILFFYNQIYYADPNWCPVPRGCRYPVTGDKSTFFQADCVVVHLPSMDRRDWQEMRRLHSLKPQRQVWAAYSEESAANYPVMDDPDIMAMFDLEISYRRGADIWVPYIKADFPARLQSTTVKPKTKLCAAFVSSGLDHSGRRALMTDLMRHLPVDSYGTFRRNRRLDDDRGPETKLRVIADYRYTLAFENSIGPDYVTEKFFEPLLAGSIPVYLGAPNVDSFAPGDRAFIDAADFDSAKALADYLLKADDDVHHAWRDRPLRRAFLNQAARSAGNPFDRLCDWLDRHAARARDTVSAVAP